MNTLSFNIKYVRKWTGDNQTDFAAKIGVSIRTLQDYESKKADPKASVLQKIADLGNYSLDWLITGDGPKQKQGEQPPVTEYFSANMVELKVYESAGAGSAIELWEAEPIEVIAVESWRIKNGAHALRVDGTSMEPTIMQGAIVLIQNHEVKLVDGGIYLLRIPDEGLIIKRVYLGYKELILRSDNGTYPEIKLPLDDGWDLQDIVIGKIDTVLIQGVK